MGRATRWLMGLFGFTKSSKGDGRSSDNQQGRGRRSNDRVLCDNVPPCVSRKDFSEGVEATWPRAVNCSESGKDQTKQAIALAAATAAVADAAVAAARAAVAMVKLTHQGQGVPSVNRSGGGERWSAAVKIQTFFRGYLARKALRALRGLVKLQALVRGYLVRRQVNAPLKRMHALSRAEATARSRRSPHRPLLDNTTHHRSRSRKSMEILDQMGDKFVTPTHSRRLSGSLDVRTVKTVHETRRINMSDFCCPSVSSPLLPGKISVPEYPWNFHEFRGEAAFAECRGSSVQGTPQFSDSAGVDNFFGEPLDERHTLRPSYMATTQSFKAKSRSLSAPRSRSRSGGLGRRLSFHEMMDFSRSSLGGARMQRSPARAQEAIDFRNAVIR